MRPLPPKHMYRMLSLSLPPISFSLKLPVRLSHLVKAPGISMLLDIPFV